MPRYYLIVFFILTGCNIGAGTLGGFEQYHFQVPVKKLEQAIDSVYSNYPDYRMPEKWRQFDSWSERGFDFLQSEMFYFSEPPEEMYYVTYIGNNETEQKKAIIGIRAINEGQHRWLKSMDLNEAENERIKKRFRTEILPKIEAYSGAKATILKSGE